MERLCAKLEGVRGTGEAVEIGEMFRHLTLQVRTGRRKERERACDRTPAQPCSFSGVCGYVAIPPPPSLNRYDPASTDTDPPQQVIAEAILSLSPEESDQTFARMYLPIVTEGNLRTWYPYRAYLPTPANVAYHRHVAVLNAYITSVIEKRCVGGRVSSVRPSAQSCCGVKSSS